MLQKYIFKAKDSEIKDYSLCLGNVSKDFAINKIKKKQQQKNPTGLKGVVKNFFVLILILN